MVTYDEILLGALVILIVGRILISAFFAAKRRHHNQIIRDLLKGDEVS